MAKLPVKKAVAKSEVTEEVIEQKEESTVEGSYCPTPAKDIDDMRFNVKAGKGSYDGLNHLEVNGFINAIIGKTDKIVITKIV